MAMLPASNQKNQKRKSQPTTGRNWCWNRSFVWRDNHCSFRQRKNYWLCSWNKNAAIRYKNSILEGYLLWQFKAQEISGMGYLGADIAIDRERVRCFWKLTRVLVFQYQIANLSGLKETGENQGTQIKQLDRSTGGQRTCLEEKRRRREDISGRKSYRYR